MGTSYALIGLVGEERTRTVNAFRRLLYTSTIAPLPFAATHPKKSIHRRERTSNDVPFRSANGGKTCNLNPETRSGQTFQGLASLF